MPETVETCGQRFMLGYISIFTVIQACALHAFIVQRETKRLNKMQAAPGIRTKAYDISRIGRNFRFEQNQVKH